MHDVIIIGSGPAGLTAAIYTTRANLKTLIIAGAKWGGQLQLTTLVENFPGFPEGIQGPDLMTAMRKQVENLGAEIVDANFTEGDFTRSAGSGQAKNNFIIKTAENTYQAKAVILATGADTKWLDVIGEQERIGRGVSSCAPCDAPFFRNKQVIVVGGGDSAMEEALVMTKYAAHVTIIHRSDSFRASKIMQDKVRANEKISIILNTSITEIKGDNKVEKVKLKNNKTGEEIEMPIDGIFVAIGHIPNTAVFKGIELDEKGFIKVHDHYRTNVEGVFTAGDVHDNQYKQAVTAAGFGCAAALEVERWLDLKED